MRTSLIGSVSDKSVQQWMGHKDWHTTMQYYEYVEKTPDPDAAATVSKVHSNPFCAGMTGLLRKSVVYLLAVVFLFP